jgi:hypothetical protein
VRQKGNVQGAIYFSSTTFDSNPNGWSDSLRNNYYKEPALVPPMPWLPDNPNKRPNSTGLKTPAAQMPMNKSGL